MLGKGVYSIAEAAHLVGVHPARLRTWFVGRPGRQTPFFEPDHTRVGGRIAISFRDLVDAWVASQFRERGLSLQSLRRIHSNLQKRFGDKHGFCHESLKTDGRTVFLHAVDDEGREKLLDLLDNQLLMPKVILPFLEQLDFDPVSHLATRWRIASGVLVDPTINFGKPIVTGSCVATAVLAEAYNANEQNAARVASWFNVSEDDVLEAVRFEHRLAA